MTKCKSHVLKGPVPVLCTGGVVYQAMWCRECDERVPVSDEDRRIQSEIGATNAAIMNGARAGMGLPPISWE